VTTTTPTFVNGDVPVTDPGLDALEAREALLDGLGDHHRPVAPAGAPDADRQVRLPFRDVLGDQEPQQVQRVLEELVRRVRLLEECPDLPVAPRMGPQVRNEVRVGQEPHVEEEVRVDRDPVLEAETEDGDDQLRAGGSSAFDVPERVPQLVDGHLRRVHDVLGQPAERLHALALFADAFEGGPVRRERVRPARLAEPPHEHVVVGVEEDQHRVEVPHALQAAEHLRNLLQHLSFAHVDDDRRPRDLVARAQRQFREHRQERHRQVVDAEVAEILERADRL
jgi:hypothetical protein